MGRSKASFVYCLSIDLIGSTKTGIEITTSKLDRFNISLVEQINPHIEKLELDGVLVKFTGDGWLLMTSDIEKVPVLCCLAKIMANNFQREMSQKTGILEDRIPPLRLAICSGRDVSVELLDKRRDWVGDSARRATRASGYCYPNEILVDEPVRYQIFRDFEMTSAEVKDRPAQPKKIEEQYPLYILSDLKPEAAADSESAETLMIRRLMPEGCKTGYRLLCHDMGSEGRSDIGTQISLRKLTITQADARMRHRTRMRMCTR
jgi:hypothetical protein